MYLLTVSGATIIDNFFLILINLFVPFVSDKMGSLPQIVNEIWTALGDTGQTIRKSIVWFIDNVSDILFIH